MHQGPIQPLSASPRIQGGLKVAWSLILEVTSLLILTACIPEVTHALAFASWRRHPQPCWPSPLNDNVTLSSGVQYSLGSLLFSGWEAAPLCSPRRSHPTSVLNERASCMAYLGPTLAGNCPPFCKRSSKFAVNWSLQVVNRSLPCDSNRRLRPPRSH